MARISKEQIQRLRAETGAPILECRRALEAAGGSVERARELLVARGMEAAAKKAERPTGQGAVGVYAHDGGRIAALVLLRCETDFVARSDAFQKLAKDLAMQVVAMNPRVVDPRDAPADAPPEETALLAQPFIRDASGKHTVQGLLASKVLELGENIQVERFVRLAV